MKIRSLSKYKISFLIFILITLSSLFTQFQLDFKDNNSNLNLNGPLTPKGIRLTSINNSSNSIVISWYTESQASDPKLIYSNEATLASNITVVPSYKLISGTYIYSASISGLDANKTYFYKVSSDSSNEKEVLNFTTSPIPNTNKIRFMVYGDTRTQREVRREIAKKR